jgi:hypothetical protein
MCEPRAPPVGWDTGIIILTALGQLLPFLSEEETHLAQMTCLPRPRRSALLLSTPSTANNRSVPRRALSPVTLRWANSPDALIATLAQALLREDAGFHAYQMLEAGVRQFREWGNCDQGRHILIASSREASSRVKRMLQSLERP